MAFTLLYNVASMDHLIRGFIGQDKEIYWIAKDLFCLLGHANATFTSAGMRFKKLKDILNSEKLGIFQFMYVLHSKDIIECFKKTNVNAFRDFLNLLEFRDISIKILKKTAVGNFQNPTKITICSPDDHDAMLFFVWLEYFKNENAMTFEQNTDLALNFANISSNFLPSEEIPNMIHMEWKNKIFSYIRFNETDTTDNGSLDNQPTQVFIFYKGRIVPFVAQSIQQKIFPYNLRSQKK